MFNLVLLFCMLDKQNLFYMKCYLFFESKKVLFIKTFQIKKGFKIITNTNISDFQK